MAGNKKFALLAAAGGFAGAVGWWWWRRRRSEWPEGLVLVESFLSKAESSELVTAIESLRDRLSGSKSSSYTPIPVPFAGRSQSRVMLQFGAYTNANRVENASRLEAMPEILVELGKKLHLAGLLDAEPDSCCVNMYETGQWIPPHVDNVKFDRPFATVSLVSDQLVVFEAARMTTSIVLPVGSALRVGGASADKWRHSIPPVTERRISVTYRRLSDATRDGFEALKTATEARKRLKAQKKRDDREEQRKAKRTYNLTKDVSKRSTPYEESESDEARDEDVVPRVEREHVWRVYDAIAPQWHGTRYKAWPRVAEFARKVGTKGALVADIGCGNGKNGFAICENGAVCCACDVSIPLLEIAQNQTRGKAHYDCHTGDATDLPYLSESFDAALNIAVLHHVSTLSRRQKAVRETLRILKTDGQALFYAWAFEQHEFQARSGHKFATSDVLVPFHLRRHGEYYDPQLTPPEHAKVDSEKNAIVLQRYCHVYKEGELEQLVLAAAEGQPYSVRIDQGYYDQGNWAIAVTKLKKESENASPTSAETSSSERVSSSPPPSQKPDASKKQTNDTTSQGRLENDDWPSSLLAIVE